MSENVEPAAEAVDAVSPESSAPSDTAPPAGESDSGEQSAQEAAEKPKQKANGVSRRIGELTRQLRERERQIQEIEARQKAQEEAKPEPKFEDFDDEQGWIQARVGWEVEQRVREAEQVREHREAERRHREHVDKVEREWATREDAARQEYDDYDEVALGDDHVVTQPMVDAIKRSDIGPQVAYYLGKHPSESNAIAELSMTDPLSAALAIGRIEGQLRANQRAQPKRSAAPTPPPENRGGAAAQSVNALSDKADIGSWMKQRVKQVRG